MSKIKTVINGILIFTLSLFLVILLLLGIVKTSVYNQESLKETLKENNYYQKVYTQIKENMEDYIRSSGFSKEILENLYTEQDVKNDIDSFVSMIYSGKVEEFDSTKIKNKLDENINNYLKENNLKITDEDSLTSFVSELTEIYKNEIRFHDMINSFVRVVPKLEKVLNIGIVVMLILVAINILILYFLKFRYQGSAFITASLLTFFIRFVVYDKIDFKNLIIFSDHFSEILQKILIHIADLIIIWGIIFLGIGIILTIIEALIRVKKKKKLKHN